ncbi:hypothetical protein MLD38_038744 [Melastoma candidum]|uniref:Uncharacterized protein n=1 Tax=Melastoma candidum TaxID=119954 RepID=A0ACB9L131_9MYRT|nr:hypothetical protein MLD38_038744 [Melastoma candidum]
MIPSGWIVVSGFHCGPTEPSFTERPTSQVPFPLPLSLFSYFHFSLFEPGRESQSAGHLFSEVVDDTTLHFQAIRLHKQIYAWIGCSSSKLGHVYAAAPTRPNNLVSVTAMLGGSSDNIGSGIARRLVLKTGLNIILSCNIPKNSPMLEANAEKILMQKLISLGYNRPKAEGCS